MDGTQDTASATFNVGAPQFAKTDGGLTQATIGDTIHYTLTITSPLGTMRGLGVTDTLPAGLIYNGDQAVSGITRLRSSRPAFPTMARPVALTWTFGDAVVASSTGAHHLHGQGGECAGQPGGVRTNNTAALNHQNAAGVASRP